MEFETKYNKESKEIQSKMASLVLDSLRKDSEILTDSIPSKHKRINKLKLENFIVDKQVRRQYFD
jgi:hypothetical protein